ncbi:extracellular solute-binding protein [Trichothermofontia sp.]
MRRRELLLTAAGLLLKQGLSGCQTSPTVTLTVQALKGSIPAQLPDRFRRARQHDPSAQRMGQRLNLRLTAVPQLDTLFSQLQQWALQAQTPAQHPAAASQWRFWPRQQPSGRADLVTLGDYWLAPAIRQGLIQPLPPQHWSHWSQVPERWQTLVRRDRQGKLQANGAVWAAPYRWGTTLIAYREDAFQRLSWEPTDWDALWRSELRHRISLPDQPREVIGLALKHLGHSYNTTDLDAIPDLRSVLRALNQQVKFYSSTTYLQPLLLGDTWLAVGWSNEILPLLDYNRGIRAVMPRSGTAIWTDIWVRPASTLQPTERAIAQGTLMDAWIDFCWDPEVAAQLSLITRAASPIVATRDRAQLPEKLRQRSLQLPDLDYLDRCEFLQPLATETLAQYRQYWSDMRQ